MAVTLNDADVSLALNVLSDGELMMAGFSVIVSAATLLVTLPKAFATMTR